MSASTTDALAALSALRASSARERARTMSDVLRALREWISSMPEGSTCEQDADGNCVRWVDPDGNTIEPPAEIEEELLR